MLPAAQMTCSLFLKVYNFYIASQRRTCENLVTWAFVLHITLKRIGKVFIVHWVASPFRAVSAVWHSFPDLTQHFQNASKDETRQSTEKVGFQRLLCTEDNQFCQKFGANSGCLELVKKLVRNTTKPKYHTAKSPKLTDYLYRKNRKPCFFGRAF